MDSSHELDLELYRNDRLIKTHTTDGDTCFDTSAMEGENSFRVVGRSDGTVFRKELSHTTSLTGINSSNLSTPSGPSPITGGFTEQPGFMTHIAESIGDLQERLDSLVPEFLRNL